MTNKPPGKVQDAPRRAETPSQQEMQMAYHAHTLAQALYGQLAMTHPFIGQAYPQMPQQPFVGQQMTPWAMQWPPMWGAGPMDPVPGPFPHVSAFYGFPHRGPVQW